MSYKQNPDFRTMNDQEGSKLKALTEISSIDISRRFEIGLEKILKITCETINAHSGAFIITGEGIDELSMVASYGLPDDNIKKVYEAAANADTCLGIKGSDFIDTVGGYHFVPNILEEQEDGPWHHLSRELGFSAQIFLPLKIGRKLKGLLNVNLFDRHAFDAEKIDFLTIIASQSAVFVQKAQSGHMLGQNNQAQKESGAIKSEEYYQLLLENASDAIYTADADGCFLTMNNAGLKIFRCNIEDIVGTNFTQWLAADNIEPARLNFGRLLAGMPADMPVTREIISKTGEHRWIELRVRAFKDVDGIISIFGMFNDITDKRNTELKLRYYNEKLKMSFEKLKKAEVNYRDLFENANDAIYVIDSGGYFQEINTAALKLFDSSRDNVISTHFSQWLTPESSEIVKAALNSTSTGKNVNFQFVNEIIRKNGEHRWIEVSGRPIAKGNNVTWFHYMARDITEKVKMEQKLVEYHEQLESSYEELKVAEKKYRGIVENASDVIYTHDSEGYMKTMNRAGLEFFRCKEDEMIGTHFSRWLTPQSNKIAQEIMGDFSTGRPIVQPQTLEFICMDGNYRYGEVKAQPIIKKGKFAAVNGVIRDVTEKKHLEQKIESYNKQLERSYRELKETEKIKKEFISNITHELLTPLTSIHGFAELISDEKIGTINEVQKKSVETIIRNAERLTRIVNDLLVISHLENKKLDLKLERISLASILSRSIQNILPQAEQKQIKIAQRFQELPDIAGDEDKLIQVIMNLLVNSIKFTPKHGNITITAAEENDQIKISIMDDGIGIPDEKLSIIFDRFYQIDGSINRKYGGMGLGLSICREIINKHNGNIWAKSNGVGSTFNITLPKFR